MFCYEEIDYMTSNGSHDFKSEHKQTRSIVEMVFDPSVPEIQSASLTNNLKSLLIKCGM